MIACVYYIYKRNKNKNEFLFTKKPSNKGFKIVEDKNKGAIENENEVVAWNALGLEQPLVIAMVGLPARGKSYLVKMIIRYLKWTGFECEVFNVGSYRRKMGMASADSSFFDNSNPNAQQIREQLAMAVQDDMYVWLSESSKRVAIFDATNTTISRRKKLVQRAKRENVFLLFVESICNDQAVLRRNYELKLDNDDYKGMDPKKAMADFMERVNAYEKVYETIQDDEDNGQISYIKLINVGQKVITSNCAGYVPSQVAFYLQNVHIQPRRIYLSLTAENLDDFSCRVGGESSVLTEAGRQYTLDLAKYIQLEQENLKGLGKELLILAGSMSLHAETVLHLRMLYSCYNTPLLNELRGGDFHGLSKEEFKLKFPEEYNKREKDKLNYRYPGVGGESYLDVIERIRPVIIELERQRRSVQIVCHLAVLRCIYAYFMGTTRDKIPYLSFKKHHIYKLTPGPFGCKCEEINPAEEIFIA
eukprot:gene17176-22692_t